MLSQKGETMLLEELKTILLRDISGVERELDLYPDDSSVWKTVSGLPNPAGNLILHLAGNLQYFFGTTLGNTGYVRNRDAEFTKRDVPRSELRKELAGSRQGVLAAFERLSENALEQPYPVKITDTDFSTRLAVLQLITHLAYHLGQIDYHRRVVTGNSASANPVAAPELVKK
jgi:Protein of unknown function (DUF1572)